MKKTALLGNIVLPDRILEGGAVLIEREKIVGVFARDESPPLEGIARRDFDSNSIAPGLIDLHLHGAMGHDFVDASAQGISAIAAHLARSGVTGYVPTILAAPLTKTLSAVECVKAAAKKDRREPEILGLYLEAPFLSLGKKGAQNPEFIRPIQAADIPLLTAAVRPLPAMITVAPEVGSNMSFIPALKEKGWVVSIGHSEATYEQAMMGFEKGMTQATHFYNAMSGFLPREPGVIGAVLDCPGITAELIADGIHVHPAALRLAVRQKGANRICLITDSLNASGLGAGNFKVGGLDVVVKNGQARLKDGGALAGSVLTLNQAVRNIMDWTGIPVYQAVRMASLNPARVLGISETVGSIEKGKLANLAVFDAEFNAIETIIRGRSIWGGKLDR